MSLFVTSTPWSFIVFLWPCVIFSVVLSLRGYAPHVEFRPEYHDIPVPGHTGESQNLEETDSGGVAQPFLNPDNNNDEILQPLLLKLATVIETVHVSVKSEMAKGSNVNMATISIPQSDAEIGCSIYSYYSTYCSVDTAAIVTLTLAPGIAGAPAPSDLFAACACYSSTYWVPDLYDNAVWACNQISSNNPDFTPYEASSFASTSGFCIWNNFRQGPYAYGLDTATSTATGTSTSSLSSSSPVASSSAASPTQSSSAVSSTMAVRWVIIELLALTIALF